MTSQFKLLPSVDAIAEQLRKDGVPHLFATSLARTAIAEMRARMASKSKTYTGSDHVFAETLAKAQQALNTTQNTPVPAVINATGTILHTGLGRAALSKRAQAAVTAASHKYCQLEFQLTSGERGDRQEHVVALLQHLTGCESALIVNNCAGALVLMLQALAYNREVIVSRGELVEIGGNFRVPDIMTSAGCRLVEVGTTNKTRIADYENAISKETALLLKVHKSNFILDGFVDEVSTKALVALGKEKNIPVAVDQGSGCLVDLSELNIHTPRITDELINGAGLVCASGDKLLGGPQAGIILGTTELVAHCKRHPLARAMRVDKLVMAALAGTLQDYVLGDPFQDIPTLAALSEALDVVKNRAQQFYDLIIHAAHENEILIEPGRSAVGSGTVPTQGVDTWTVTLTVANPDHIAQQLRLDPTHVITRITRGKIVFDMRTVSDDEIKPLATAVNRVLCG